MGGGSAIDCRRRRRGGGTLRVKGAALVAPLLSPPSQPDVCMAAGEWTDRSVGRDAVSQPAVRDRAASAAVTSLTHSRQTQADVTHTPGNHRLTSLTLPATTG